VTFRSEAARVDLNAAPRSLLAGLIVGIGANPSDAASYVDRIIAWRTPTEAADDDPENSFYRTSGASYLPRHAPFPQAEELWLVRGIPPLVIEKMLPFVTVFSNLASINVLDAAPQVLAALPGMTPGSLQEVLALRADPNADPNAVRAAAGGEGATLDGSKAYRLTVQATSGTGVGSAADVVILLLDGGAEAYRVLSWRNAADGGMAPQRTARR
jgi:general secretion pathway protein K